MEVDRIFKTQEIEKSTGQAKKSKGKRKGKVSKEEMD